METIRNGQIVWPYCKDCGCRLDIVKIGSTFNFISHYGNMKVKDARGCICPSVGVYWILRGATVFTSYLIGV